MPGHFLCRAIVEKLPLLKAETSSRFLRQFVCPGPVEVKVPIRSFHVCQGFESFHPGAKQTREELASRGSRSVRHGRSPGSKLYFSDKHDAVGTRQWFLLLAPPCDGWLAWTEPGRWTLVSRIKSTEAPPGGFDRTGIRAQSKHFHPHRPRPPRSFIPFYLALKGNVILSQSKQVGSSVIRHPLNGQSPFAKKKQCIHTPLFLIHHLAPDLRLARVTYFASWRTCASKVMCVCESCGREKKKQVKSPGAAALTASYRLHTHTHSDTIFSATKGIMEHGTL